MIYRTKFPPGWVPRPRMLATEEHQIRATIGRRLRAALGKKKSRVWYGSGWEIMMGATARAIAETWGIVDSFLRAMSVCTATGTDLDRWAALHGSGSRDPLAPK